MPMISTIIIYKAINAKPQKRQHFNKRDHRSTNASNNYDKTSQRKTEISTIPNKTPFQNSVPSERQLHFSAQIPYIQINKKDDKES
jgi:hypothetical protein